MQTADLCRIRGVVRLVELEEVGILEGLALDDIIAVLVDQGEFDVLELLLREDPFFFQFREGQYAKQNGVLRGSVFGIAQRDPVAEGERLLAVHRVRIGARDVDRRSDVRDPRRVGKEIHRGVGYRVVVLGSEMRAGRNAPHAVEIDQMRGGVRQNVRDPDERRRLFHRRVPVVDIVRPYVADALFADQIVFGDALHRDGHVLEMLGLPFPRIPVDEDGVHRDESQDREHNEDVDDDDSRSFHIFQPFFA